MGSHLFKNRKAKKYIFIRAITLLCAVGFIACYALGAGHIPDIWTAIGWFIGLSAFGWGAYTDFRVKLVPNTCLMIMLLSPLVAWAGTFVDGNIRGIVIRLSNTLAEMSLAAGALWIFSEVMSSLLGREALGPADIFPCAMVAGLTLNGLNGILVFLLTPYIVLPLLMARRLITRLRGDMRVKSGLKNTLPLFPALYLSTFIMFPVSEWVKGFLW